MFVDGDAVMIVVAVVRHFVIITKFCSEKNLVETKKGEKSDDKSEKT